LLAVVLASRPTVVVEDGRPDQRTGRVPKALGDGLPGDAQFRREILQLDAARDFVVLHLGRGPECLSLAVGQPERVVLGPPRVVQLPQIELQVLFLAVLDILSEAVAIGEADAGVPAVAHPVGGDEHAVELGPRVVGHVLLAPVRQLDLVQPLVVLLREDRRVADGRVVGQPGLERLEVPARRPQRQSEGLRIAERLLLEGDVHVGDRRERGPENRRCQAEARDERHTMATTPLLLTHLADSNVRLDQFE
jgi:hypothetical protein